MTSLAPKALVTFNGIRFDTKFITREFPEIILPESHVDLRYLCRRVGLTGGQKAIENELGIGFRDDSTNMDGAAAVIGVPFALRPRRAWPSSNTSRAGTTQGALSLTEILDMISTLMQRDVLLPGWQEDCC